jgi:hypothetical protein
MVKAAKKLWQYRPGWDGSCTAIPVVRGGAAVQLPPQATNVTPDKLGLHKKAVPGHDWESL